MVQPFSTLTVAQAEQARATAWDRVHALWGQLYARLGADPAGRALVYDLDNALADLAATEEDAVFARLMAAFPGLGDIYRRAVYPDGGVPDHALP